MSHNSLGQELGSGSELFLAGVDAMALMATSCAANFYQAKVTSLKPFINYIAFKFDEMMYPDV